MYRRASRIAVIVGVAVGLLLVPGGNALAATPVQGLTINPSLKNIAIQPSQTTVSFLTTLENDSDAPLRVTPQASDFSTSGVNGAIRLQATPDKAHGLAAHMTFSRPQLILEPHKEATIGVNITGADSLSPGGHFAAVRYQAESTNNKTGQVAFRAEVVGFVFVTTAGRATYDLKTQWDTPAIVWGSLPQSTNLLFANHGNTQIAPHGTVTISGPGQKNRQAQGVINANSSLVLPGATRLLQTGLQQKHPAIWPGRYTMDLYYRTTSGESYTHIQRHFWFVGWPTLLGIVILVVSAIVLPIGWRRWRKSKVKISS